MLPEQVHGVGVNVGSQIAYHGRGPIHQDGSFEFVPIPESDDTVTSPTYGDYELETDIVDEHADQVVHADPEFPELPGGKHYTYGDPHETKTDSLRKLEVGDYLFFFGTLDYAGSGSPEYWINPDWGGYIFGHFELAIDPIVGKDEFGSAPDYIKNQFTNNAHVRRDELEDDIVLLLGDPGGSKLYQRPIPLSDTDPELSHRERFNDSIEDRGTNFREEWYRGPLEFDTEVTNRLIQAEQAYQFHRVLYPTVNSLPASEIFTDKLGKPSTFDSLRELITDNSEYGPLTQEEKLFASFSYISAAWTTTVPRRILEAVDRPIESSEDVLNESDIKTILIETFTDVRNETDWPHGHRWYYPISAGHYRDKDEGESLVVGMANLYLKTLETFPHPSFEEFIREIEASEQPFHTGFDSIRKAIKSFGRTPAFDWLEVLVNVHGYDTFAPNRLHWDYVRGDNSKPEQGFKLMYAIDSLDAMVDPDDNRKNQMLHRLVEYSKETIGMGAADAVFAVESALCNCARELNATEPEEVDRNTGGSPPC